MELVLQKPIKESIKKFERNLKTPDYLKLLDLTSSHINFGGWQCCDFVCTLDSSHNNIQFIKEETEVPTDEFILGWIRCDSGILNNKPLQEYLGQNRSMPDFVNAHVMNAKVLVPTAQFGRMRGGKLLALLSQSNEIRDFFNEKYKNETGQELDIENWSLSDY